MEFFTFLNNTWFQTILLAVAGFTTLYIYYKQKNDEIKYSAALIKLEIDSIENAFSKIKDIQNPEEIFRHNPIYQDIEWFKRRSLLISKMDIEYINKINDFYSQSISFEEARKVLKDSITINRLSKAEYMQKDVLLIIKEQVDLFYKDEKEILLLQLENNTDKQIKIYNLIQAKINTFQNMYNSPRFSPDFYPNTIFTYYDIAKSNFKNISNTPAYEMLKKISNNKKTKKK